MNFSIFFLAAPNKALLDSATGNWTEWWTLLSPNHKLFLSYAGICGWWRYHIRLKVFEYFLQFYRCNLKDVQYKLRNLCLSTSLQAQNWIVASSRQNYNKIHCNFFTLWVKSFLPFNAHPICWFFFGIGEFVYLQTSKSSSSK